jgi:hypothetical protein
LFFHRNSETYDIQLPPRPSVGQGAIAANAKNFDLFAGVAVVFIPSTLKLLLFYRFYGLVIGQMTIYEIGT